MCSFGLGSMNRHSETENNYSVIRTTWNTFTKSQENTKSCRKPPRLAGLQKQDKAHTNSKHSIAHNHKAVLACNYCWCASEFLKAKKVSAIYFRRNVATKSFNFEHLTSRFPQTQPMGAACQLTGLFVKATLIHMSSGKLRPDPQVQMDINKKLCKFTQTRYLM